MQRLEEFLAGLTPLTDSETFWAAGSMRLRGRSYLTNNQPPADVTTSARGIVTRDGDVMVLRNRDGMHMLPGGRIEPGETPEAAFAREVLEESGWRIGHPSLVGCVHLRHLSPRPEAYRFPYPDFVWVVFTAEALEEMSKARFASDYEEAAWFVPRAELNSLPIEPNQLVFARTIANAQKDRSNRLAPGPRTRSCPLPQLGSGPRRVRDRARYPLAFLRWWS